MRDRADWRRPLEDELKNQWPEDPQAASPAVLCEVELTLFLIEELAPGHPAMDGWTLLGGYPFLRALGGRPAPERELMLARARLYLGRLQRRYLWRQELIRYTALPEHIRGYDVPDLEKPAIRRVVTPAAQRWDLYARTLRHAPGFEHRPLPTADAGEHWFLDRQRHRRSVRIPDELVLDPARGHDLDAPASGAGEAREVPWRELMDTARSMDETLRARQLSDQARWVKRLERVELHLLTSSGEARTGETMLRLDGLMHLVGMVGAGKSTLRDVLAVWAAGQGLRTTLVVGDVAEVLNLVNFFRTLGIGAAPILGSSTRERHIERLHRRLGTRQGTNLLAHDDAGFDFLSSACPLDGLRGLEASEPLRLREAPCTDLFPADEPDKAPIPGVQAKATRRKRRPRRHGCPIWSACPRHFGHHEQVDAPIWIATPASLVHSSVPRHQNEEEIRFLELTCRRSDLIVVDEADRVQTQLDSMFSPATTLVGRAPDSWLDDVQEHKIVELAQQGRLQLSEQTVETWVSAMDIVTAATNRLYALLVRNPMLRRWASEDYFSAWTLHQQLLDDWHPLPKNESSDAIQEIKERRKRLNVILDAFRDDPLGDGVHPEPQADALVRLCHEVLTTVRAGDVRERVRDMLLRLSGLDPADRATVDVETLRFEFTLLLSALHHRLDIATGLWPVVEATLRLDASSNVLSRRPPADYMSLIPESPMGNVLGFQFLPDDRSQGADNGERTGELRFFRCAGVGRELLLRLHRLTAADDRPGPHVVLMSGTSWAGSSSRYHVHAPVDAILKPPRREIEAITSSEFRTEFLPGPDGRALRLSGNTHERPIALERMLRQLAMPTVGDDPSPLALELQNIEDPDRRRILLLVGSYDEAKRAARILDEIPEWAGRVCRLVSDDADLDHAWQLVGRGAAGRGGTLRRGDVAGFAGTGADVLVVPLLAIERGHNILNAAGQAAIGSVYFLARPHPRPDDISLAVQAINDWAVRTVRDGSFDQRVRELGSLDRAGQSFGRQGRRMWRHLLTRKVAWSSMPRDEQEAFTWDQLVVIWQVIGRLVRGGVPARVAFVDGAFSPRDADLTGTDTPETSLLHSMRAVLRPYFNDDNDVPARDRDIVRTLYGPLHQALLALP
jgi:hypothetical protein